MVCTCKRTRMSMNIDSRLRKRKRRHPRCGVLWIEGKRNFRAISSRPHLEVPCQVDVPLLDTLTQFMRTPIAI